MNSIFYILFFSTMCISSMVQSYPAAKDSMVHTQGVLSTHSKTIFELLGYGPITTLAEANAIAQKDFLRQGERWDVQESNPLHMRMQEKRGALLAELKAIGMLDEMIPTQTHYDYAFVLGGLTERTRLRIQEFEQLVSQGYTFGQVTFFGSGRLLQDFEKQGLPGSVTTEAQMMRYFYDQSSIKGFPAIFIDSPMKKIGDKIIRPTTDDTFRDFLLQNPKPGTCLVISNNPYLARQIRVAEYFLPSNFVVTGVGEAAKSTIDIIIALDEFARLLYQELLISKKQL